MTLLYIELMSDDPAKPTNPFLNNPRNKETQSNLFANKPSSSNPADYLFRIPTAPKTENINIIKPAQEQPADAANKQKQETKP